jgi:hypothetical protein
MMKKLNTALVLLFLVAVSYVAGIVCPVGSLGTNKNPTGLPKVEIPPVGSVLRVEYVDPDGNFVAKYAGARLYYKPVVTTSKIKIIIEAGKAYEVVDQKTIIAGGHQKVLVPIN